MKLTRQQRIALKNVYDRHKPKATYREFRRTVRGAFGSDQYVLVPIPRACLWLGIEPDGYTHS